METLNWETSLTDFVPIELWELIFSLSKKTLRSQLISGLVVTPRCPVMIGHRDIERYDRFCRTIHSAAGLSDFDRMN